MDLPGGYAPVRLLGQGRTGTSWLAHRPARLRVDGDHVVVKVFGDPLTDGQFELLSAELATLAQLADAALLPLYEAGIDDGRAHVVMAYAAAGSLECPRRPLARGETLHAVAVVARGLAALHDADIAHGNIKPTNVLLGDPGAWLSDPASAAWPPLPAPVEYVDPDVLRGAAPSRSSDVWSLGVTLHRALTGSSLYGEVPEVDRNAAVHHVLGSRPRLGGGLHPGEALVIGGCLVEAAGERPTATEVANRIEALVEGAG